MCLSKKQPERLKLWFKIIFLAVIFHFALVSFQIQALETFVLLVTLSYINSKLFSYFPRYQP